MSYVVVGCDINAGNDAQVQNTVVQALKNQGHKVEKLKIHPTPFGQYDWGEAGYNPKGKIGVYIIADGIYSISDRYANPGGFKYVYFIVRGDLESRPRMRTRKHFENNPIGADPDCSGVCQKLKGKSFAQMNNIVKKKCWIVFGRNAKEMADELISAMGGSKTSKKGSKDKLASKVSQGGTIKDALQKLLTHWDGKVECYIRGNEVHINKVREPDKFCSCVLEEGFNIFSDSVNVTDVNPNTVNYLEVVWKGGTIVIKDEVD